jgi:hypothetical protein
MILSDTECREFFRILMKLLNFVNKKLKLYPQVGEIIKPTDLPMEKTAALREKLWENPGFIDDYIEKYAGFISSEEIVTVKSWKNNISGRFMILKQLKKFAVFIHLEDDGQVYGVLGLESSMEEIAARIGRRFPLMVKAVLLPYSGRIVYDGFIAPYNILFGRGVRSGYNEIYGHAKSERKLITFLN